MNQPQREFLIKHIERAHKKHDETLAERKPTPPSLNNYLIAAILEGSFELRSTEELRSFIRQMVISLGPSGTFVKKASRSRWDDDDDSEHSITLNAEALFILPAEYQTARAKYESDFQVWTEETEHAAAIKDTLVLKVQIGSNDVLKRLVDQVDNMADLQLVNNRLLLTEGESENDSTNSKRARG